MKQNYHPWEINLKEFAQQKDGFEQLSFLVNFAVLAPSSHNSQPWRFVVGNDGISIFTEYKRALPHSDKNNRQLFISLGCALENLLIAADYYGFEASYEYEKTNNEIKVFLKRTRKPVGGRNHLIFSIPKRHTNRGKYSQIVPDKTILEKLQSHSNSNIQILFTTEKETIKKIAEIVVEALVTAMDDKMFREELSHFVKPNTTNSPLGMPAFGFGISTPISLIAPKLLKYVNMNKLSRKQDLELLKNHTPALGVIATTEDNPRAWIEAGKIYESIALSAEENNLKTAPMAAVIQIDNFYKDLQSVLNTHLRPQIFFRLGYCQTTSPPSPRL